MNQLGDYPQCIVRYKTAKIITWRCARGHYHKTKKQTLDCMAGIPPKSTDEEIRQLAERFLDGESIPELSAELKVSPNKLRGILNKWAYSIVEPTWPQPWVDRVFDKEIMKDWGAFNDIYRALSMQWRLDWALHIWQARAIAKAAG